MPKRKKGKITARELKHDALRDKYLEFAEWVKLHRQPVIRLSATVVGVLVIIVASLLITSYRQERAEAAFAEAYEIFDAEVTQGPPNDPTRRTYSSEEQKYREALHAFTRVAKDYSGYREIAQYYAALCKLHLKQPDARSDLERLSSGNSRTAKLAKIALAEHLLASGDYGGAEQLYRQLLSDGGELPESLIRLDLARSLEFQGKKTEAVELYLKIASDYRSKEEGREAIERLMLLDPSALEKVPPEKESEK